MKKYSTVMSYGQAEHTIERSRFIARVKPVKTREEADAFFDEIRKSYRDATHNVPALVLGEKQQIQWGSDDGEPQGTSGAPMVQYLVTEGLTNVAVIVTRYFGGIKLGTGGLVRAYTKSAQIGVMVAGICDVEEMSVLSCVTDYKGFHRIENHDFGLAAGRPRAVIEQVSYTDVVSFDLVCFPEIADEIREELSGLTAGTLVVEGEQVRDVQIPRGE